MDCTKNLSSFFCTLDGAADLQSAELSYTIWPIKGQSRLGIEIKSIKDQVEKLRVQHTQDQESIKLSQNKTDNLCKENTELVSALKTHTTKSWASVASPQALTTLSSSADVASLSSFLGGDSQAAPRQTAPRQTTTKSRPKLEDNPTCITIFANMYQGNKQDFDLIKTNSQLSISSFKALAGVKIAYLQPMVNDRINFVFTDKYGADNASEQEKWLKKALPGARM
ncbi:Hypothetical protein D9617_61g013190 [Elsinoe fawcettii]|nr:Hypothetical protein D9617_61g013190 [Elsinoe fawcettii]